jgi:hypothetical protein
VSLEFYPLTGSRLLSGVVLLSVDAAAEARLSPPGLSPSNQHNHRKKPWRLKPRLGACGHEARLRGLGRRRAARVSGLEAHGARRPARLPPDTAARLASTVK